MSRYQHPPTETLLQPLDHVISARVAEIRQAYRDAAGSRTFPDLNTLWTAALADVRAALDIIDPPAPEPTDHVRVPLLGVTRHEKPARCRCGLRPEWAAPEAHFEGCDYRGVTPKL